MDVSLDTANRLGAYLRDCRARLDPASLGFSNERRRTPGLRREEVAQRAHISPTWYTWLEQGRGGAPSADVLDRIARALLLTNAEREHLFLLGLGRPPEARYHPTDGVTPRLQRVLDTLNPSPAMIRTATWTVVAWNLAATRLFTDYGALPPSDRNILRMMFLNPEARAMQADWESVARFLVAAFRVETLRAGADAAIAPLVDELCHASPQFKRLWQENEVPLAHTEAIKRLYNPELGWLGFEYSTFAVDGRTDLSMIVFNPATTEDAVKIRTIL